MNLRDKVTSELLKRTPIPSEKQDPNYSFYYNDYNDNLFCKLGPDALAAYDHGSGAEIRRNSKGEPPKMASIASSSAMTFNLLGDGPVEIEIPHDFKVPSTLKMPPLVIPAGKYTVHFEKQMYTVNSGSLPANLDAFLYNEDNKTAIFCEMKTLEWLSSPGDLKDAYCDKSSYFTPHSAAVNSPENAYQVFKGLIDQLKLRTRPDPKKAGHELLISKYSVYDAWQMLKHTLAIYNYTSLVTRDSVESFRGGKIPSLAGKFDTIVLLNVVNELPPDWFTDEKVKNDYLEREGQEKSQAADFIDLMMDPNNKLGHLFDQNCGAMFDIAYMSAKEFSDLFDMDSNRRQYLKRYFD